MDTLLKTLLDAAGAPSWIIPHGDGDSRTQPWFAGHNTQVQ